MHDATHEDGRERPGSGHNKPPSQIEFAWQTGDALNEWFKINPVVTTEEQAREGKLLVDRARASLAEMEGERKARVAPLQQQVLAIDDEYRPSRSILSKLLDELKGRLHAWVKAEEARRIEAAQKARRKAEEAERIAREAEARECEAKDDARAGVETDVGGLTKDADRTYREFTVAQRDAARAQVATSVKIGGGFGRALSLHALEKRELVVTAPDKLLAAMGWSERLIEALKSDARAYRIEYGKWPDGIIEEIR